MKKGHLIISIGRECGSGGHEIGEKLAAHYGIKLYDKNLLDILASKTKQDVDELSKLEEKVSGQFFGVQKDGFASQQGMLMNKLTKSDQLFMQEKSLILQLAREESFVIIGRAANAILDDCPDTLRLYIYASDSFKIPRVKEFYHLDTDAEAEKKMKVVDKARQDYFHYYSNMIWGSKDGHDCMLDSSVFGIDGCVEIIKDLVERKLGISKEDN